MLQKAIKTITSPFFLFLIPLILAFLVWFFLYYYLIAFSVPGAVGGDTADYAQIARQLFLGKGFTSNVTFAVPLDFYKSININKPPWPDVWRNPFLTSSIAVMYKFFGVSDFAVIFTSGFYYILTTAIIFLTAKQLSNSKVAFLTAIFWIFFPGAIFFSFRGYKQPPAAFLVSTITLFLFLAHKRKLAALLLGAFLGLYFLMVDSLAFSFLIPILIYWFWKERMKCALVFLGFISITSPWLFRNYRLTGDPFFSIIKNCTIPANIITSPDTPQDLCGRFPLIEIVPFVLSHPREMIIKYFFGVFELLKNLPNIVPVISITILSCYWISFLIKSKNSVFRDSSFIFLAALFIQIFVQPLASVVISQFFYYSPVIIIFGTVCFFELTGSLKKQTKKLIVFTFVFITLMQTLIVNKENLGIRGWFSTRFQTPNEGFLQRILLEDIELIKKHTTEEDIVVASFPFEVAFYGERKTFQVLPENNSFDQYRRLYNESLPFESIYISWRHLHAPWPIAWWDNNNINDFELTQKMPSGSVLLKKRANGDGKNLIADPSQIVNQKIPISAGKNYLFSLKVYSPKDFNRDSPIAININYYDSRNRLLFAQEVGNTSLRKDYWNFLSENLFPPKGSKYIMIEIKPLSEGSDLLKFKYYNLKEIYLERGYL
jgi:hypothetical protein